MEDIIAPVSKELLKAELTEDKRLRMTNRSNNQIYIVTAHDSPHTMQEIGRLREIAFRAAGGGTGKSVDIDEFDVMEHPYKQLIVWNPEAEEILGGYRYILGTDVRFDDKGTSPTSSCVNISPPPLSWPARSSRWSTSAPVWITRGSSPWIIFGTGWAR